MMINILHKTLSSDMVAARADMEGVRLEVLGQSKECMDSHIRAME